MGVTVGRRLDLLSFVSASTSGMCNVSMSLLQRTSSGGWCGAESHPMPKSGIFAQVFPRNESPFDGAVHLGSLTQGAVAVVPR